MPDQTDDRIDKRRVTMRSVVALPNGDIATHECVDFVRPDFLEAYVAVAKTRWHVVEVSDEPDAGPGGYDGDTYIPEQLGVASEDNN